MDVEANPRGAFAVRPRGEVDNADIDRTYIRISPVIVRPGVLLPFCLYRREEGEALRLMAEENAKVPDDLPSHLGAPQETVSRFYVRADQRGALLHYQELLLGELLRDGRLSLDAKSEVLQSQTTLLSQDMFEEPTSALIARQRKTIREMVDFVVREPEAIHALLRLTHYDYYTYTHSVNVGVYALWLLVEHFRRQIDLDMHETAAAYFLHDIGKCRVDPAIVKKPGKLTPAEWVEMRKHPEYGYTILMEQKHLTPENAIVVLQHHERMDGMGYPQGLKGDEVHPYARVCGLVDAFDALTTRRSYKPALTQFEALDVMKDQMYVQFDPEIFKTFVLLCRRKG